MTHIEYKGLDAGVKFNERNGVYSARANGLAGTCVQACGSTPEELEKNYYDTIDQYIRYMDAALSISRAA